MSTSIYLEFEISLDRLYSLIILGDRSRCLVVRFQWWYVTVEKQMQFRRPYECHIMLNWDLDRWTSLQTSKCIVSSFSLSARTHRCFTFKRRTSRIFWPCARDVNGCKTKNIPFRKPISDRSRTMLSAGWLPKKVMTFFMSTCDRPARIDDIERNRYTKKEYKSSFDEHLQLTWQCIAYNHRYRLHRQREVNWTSGRCLRFWSWGGHSSS